ncbi:MAG: rhodanese-like domain-containing protein [Chitinophagales bacterium]|nr:rhodanese-like domain-containing protein [Chitinophagales bacterium]
MQEITVEQLKNRVAAGEKLHVIDVREPDEYQEYNIGAKLIPLGNIMSMQIDELEDLKNEELIIHCRSGKRSMQACMVLEQMGFTNTVNVIGGVMAWHEKYGNDKL